MLKDMEKIYEEAFYAPIVPENEDGACVYKETDNDLMFHTGIECEVHAETNGRKGKWTETNIEITLANAEEIRELDIKVERDPRLKENNQDIRKIIISTQGEYELNTLLNILKGTYDMLKKQIQNNSNK